MLVSIDGTSAAHDVIDHLTSLTTAPEHRRRGRRMEYTTDWPVDDPTMAGIEQLSESDGGAAVHTDGEVDPRRPGGRPDRGPAPRSTRGSAGQPADLHVSTRRTPRPAGKPAKLDEHPEWEYGAFATTTAHRQVQFLDARHHTQAHVEDQITQFTACGAHNLPSIDHDRNTAWLQLAALTTTLTA